MSARKHINDGGEQRRMSALSINPALTPVDAVWYGQTDSETVIQQQPQPFITVNPEHNQKALMHDLAAPDDDEPPCYDDAVMQPPQQLQQPSQLQPIIMQPGALIHQSQEPQEKPMQLNHQQSPDCPIGLEFLLGLDKVQVQQQKISSETSKEVLNRYSIRNSKGVQMYYAIESDDPVPRRVVRLEWSRRTFHYKIMDNLDQHVFSVCRKQYITPECVVETPIGETIGYINKSFGFCKSEITISDGKRGLLFTIPGPCCCEGYGDGARCFDNKEYPIRSAHLLQVGAIVRKFSGYSQDRHANPDTFEITFPVDLDVRVKAVLISTALFLDVLELKRK